MPAAIISDKYVRCVSNYSPFFLRTNAVTLRSMAPTLPLSDGVADSVSTQELPTFSPSDRLPFSGLLALTAAGFMNIFTKALPAGLLPQISVNLAISESLAGQFVTLYAMGSLVAAIPLAALAQGWRRRPILLFALSGFALSGFAVVNFITAVSTSHWLTLGARFFAGVFAGLLWTLIPGYASRMVAAPLKGRAIAVAMIGPPLAFSLGIPAGTFLGAAIGWRYVFGIMSFLTLILIGWVFARVPDFAGQSADKRTSVAGVFVLPGIRPVLFVTLTYVLAHNLLYTYIVPFLRPAGSADIVLFVFGVSAIASTWIVGMLIDRWLRELVLASTILFTLATVALGVWGNVPLVVNTGVAAWGLAFGGVATLFPTAAANAAGEAVDIAQSMIVTVWNIAIAGGGLAGGMLLETFGVGSFPWALIALLVPALLVTWQAKNYGFPSVSCR